MIDTEAASCEGSDGENAKCCVCDLEVNAEDCEECEECGSPVCDDCSFHEDGTPCLVCMAIAEEEDRERVGRESGAAARPTAKAGRSPVRHVRLGADLDGALRRESGRTGATASEVIRRALAAFLG